MPDVPRALSEQITAREVIRLAVPGMLFAVLTHGYRTVDQYWIQGVSTEAQAAIGSSFFVLIVFFAAFELIAAGAGPLVARATGAGDLEGRRQIIGASASGALAAAIGVAIVGGLGAEALAAAVGLYGETAQQFALYLRAIALTALPLAFTPLVDQAFIATGDARTPMALQAGSLALNIALTPLFIYGLDLGIVGAALASNASRAASTGLGCWLLWRAVGMRPGDLRMHAAARRSLARAARVGAPMAFGTLTYALVYWALLYLAVSPLGPEVNAALGIGFSALESFSWPAFHGVSLAVASLVGRSLGAGRPDQARAAIRLALPLSTGLGLAVTLIFWLGGEALTGLFTEDPAVHVAATEYAVILAFSQVFVAWETLAEGALAGSGDTRTLFWLSAPLNALRVPLAWWLAFQVGWGAAGIWWAINLTSAAKALCKGAAVRWGGWAELEI